MKIISTQMIYAYVFPYVHFQNMTTVEDPVKVLDTSPSIRYLCEWRDHEALTV